MGIFVGAFCLELGRRGRWKEAGEVVKVVEGGWGQGKKENMGSVWRVCLSRELFLLAFRQTSRKGGEEKRKGGNGEWVDEGSFRFIVDFLPQYLDDRFPYLDKEEWEEREREMEEEREKEKIAEEGEIEENEVPGEEYSTEEDWWSSDEEDKEKEEDEEEEKESQGEEGRKWNLRREKEVKMLLCECRNAVLLVSVMVAGLVRPLPSLVSCLLTIVEYLKKRKREERNEKKEERGEEGWMREEEEKEGSVEYLGGLVKEYFRRKVKDEEGFGCEKKQSLLAFFCVLLCGKR